MTANTADDADFTQLRRRGRYTRRSAQWNIAHVLDGQQFTPGAQSLHRGLMVLDVVAVMARDEPGGVSLADLARITSLPKPSLHRLLVALTEAGYVERVEPAGTYRLGLQAHVLGQLATSARDVLRDACADSLVRLAELSEDTTFLTVRQGSYGLCLRREEGSGVIRNNAMDVGDRHPLGVGAGSLAILAELGDDEVEDVLERNAHLLSRNYPLIDAPTLRQLVRRARRDGYATNPGLAAPGSWAIGVAVSDEAGRPVAAMSIASIEQRLTGPHADELIEAMHAEATHIQTRLVADSTTPATPHRPARPARRPTGETHPDVQEDT